jgi:hypothetical protein
MKEGNHQLPTEVTNKLSGLIQKYPGRDQDNRDRLKVRFQKSDTGLNILALEYKPHLSTSWELVGYVHNPKSVLAWPGKPNLQRSITDPETIATTKRLINEGMLKFTTGY